MASVRDTLASALDRNDERPNVELAADIAARGDKAAVEELVGALTSGAVAVQNDAIKVLYEIGALKPALVAPHAGAFVALLGSKNNRNVWGALQAIETVAPERPSEVRAALDAVLAAADKGSVIAKDKAVGILTRLAAAGHAAKVLPVALERLRDAAPNQFPMYAELIGGVVDAANKPKLIAIIEQRLRKVDSEAKRKRIEKLLRKLTR
jgi:hypothetical protein